MESFGGLGFGNVGNTVRKKRSKTSRRPQISDHRDISSLSSSPTHDNASKASSEENTHGSSYRKELNLNQCSSGASPKDKEGSRETRLKKVKLRVGGVMRTIHTKTSSDGASVGGSTSTKSSHSNEASRSRQKRIQENLDDNPSPPGKGSGLRGVPWKDFSRGGFSVGKPDSLKQEDKYEPVRKSKRVPKKRVLDDEENDDEIRYLEKLKTSKTNSDFVTDYIVDDEEGTQKQRKISKVLNTNSDRQYTNSHVAGQWPSRSVKDGKKSRSGRGSEDTDYDMEDDEVVSDSGPTDSKRRKLRKEVVDVLGDSKKEMAVTTRQRALQSGKDVSSGSGAGLIEFPNGLPPAPPRKQKEKLTEVEQQLKKAEAAQRRRVQVEKAARESEAEAIRKILGQDSSRKKREDKIKKRQEELAQEKAANAMTLESDMVRWVMGPTGTVVIFPKEMGLPSIFHSKQCNYPPPREECAGPSCTNPYKYRDSKSKLPLCSLQCYKALRTAC